MEPTAKLLEVAVQPTIVVDTGDGLRKVTGAPIIVAGADWERWTGSTPFGPDEIAEAATQIAADQAKPEPKRRSAIRRKK